jgi:hypothetical protein
MLRKQEKMGFELGLKPNAEDVELILYVATLSLEILSLSRRRDNGPALTIANFKQCLTNLRSAGNFRRTPHILYIIKKKNGTFSDLVFGKF